jgi:hypothetical protein
VFLRSTGISYFYSSVREYASTTSSHLGEISNSILDKRYSIVALGVYYNSRAFICSKIDSS